MSDTLLPIILVQRENITIPTTKDEVRDLWLQSEACKRVFTSFMETVNAVMVDAIRELGAVEAGEALLCAKLKKSAEKGQDIEGAVDELLTACGGDIEKFASCLASGALKPGRCQEVAGPDFRARFFTRPPSQWKLEDLEARRNLEVVPIPLHMVKNHRKQLETDE